METNNIDKVITILENDSIQLFKWFSDNQMKAKKDKYHLIISNNEKVSMKIDNIEKENTSSENLLGVIIDSKLNFKGVPRIIKKTSWKVNVLSRITPYMSLTKRKLLMNSFFTSQFNYYLLVWMCHYRTFKNKINHLHERCLRIVYKDNKSCQEQLDKDKGVTIHVKYVRALAVDMFKVSNN